MVSPPPTHAGDPPPELFGGIFVGIGGCLMIFGWTIAILAFSTARNLPRRRRRILCMVTACITCLSVPLGTLLGVFTLVVMNRPTVKDSFV